jgi:mannitol/fructose-specific phosphotransferase system IIA component (Ntr-type)
MPLSRFLDRRLVKVPVESSTSEEVIAELVEEMVRAGRVKDRAAVLEALYARERKGSTGIGGGFAVPHARHESVSDAVLAVGIGREDIEFASFDDKPVRVVFLLVAAAERPGQAVGILAEIGQLAQTPGAFEKLTAAADADAVIAIIREVEEKQWATPSSGS